MRIIRETPTYLPATYSVHYSPNFTCILMEFMGGGDLMQHLIDESVFKEPVARHVICQMLKGLVYIHDVLGCTHRDIKPDNIVFTSKGELKFIDLGFCRAIPEGLNNPYNPENPIHKDWELLDQYITHQTRLKSELINNNNNNSSDNHDDTVKDEIEKLVTAGVKKLSELKANYKDYIYFTPFSLIGK